MASVSRPSGQKIQCQELGNGKLQFKVNEAVFIIDDDYEVTKVIGRGAYGVVVAAIHTPTGTPVAIKKIANVFGNEIETKRTIREIKLLKALGHENIIGLQDLMWHEREGGAVDMYFVHTKMDTDLHQIIISQQPLTDAHIAFFIYQILRALKFIHSAGALHRDIKPSNVLVNGDCDLKVCDFGLARVNAFKESGSIMEFTEYVATRWYRAPEIMLSWREYGQSVDIWSTGCIMGELINRQPLFPGKDYMDQVHKVLNVLGTPNNVDSEFISSDKAKRYIRNLDHRPGIDWKKAFPKASPAALDLLSQMLQFNPNKRISVDDALQHKYFVDLHDAEDEPTFGPNELDFSYEQKLSRKAMKELLYNEYLDYRNKKVNGQLYYSREGSATEDSVGS